LVPKLRPNPSERVTLAQQRRAVEHGGSALAEAGPLLIIAGAGSGKTNTLAHRVAHLIVNGADPRRIMLLTFSRRCCRRDDATR
jgi:DNA helicase II / ATP-dependent DNA helicase PcrA